MKQMKMALLIGLLPAITFAQKRDFTITADFGPGVTNKVMFNRYTLSTGQHKDTLLTTNGKVTFKGTVNEERQIAQVISLGNDTYGSAIFYLEPGNITISLPHKGEQGYPIVGGTPLNRDYQQYRVMINNMVDSAKLKNTTVRNFSEFNPEVQNSKFEVIKKFMKKYPTSPINVDLLNQMGIGYKKPELLLAQYEKLTPAAQKSPEGKELFTRIKGMGAAKIGDYAPNFTLPDTQGNNVSLTSFKGKYLLIDFWATWCGPCMAEMPNLVKAYSLYKNKNFEIVGVSLDRPDSKALWLKKIKEEGLNWPQQSDLKWWNSTAALLYNINSVPANFLLDPTGKIIATNLRGEALQQKLTEILN